MDDLSEKINELLSDPESMERIKNLAGMLAGNGNSNQKAAPDKNRQPDDSDNTDGFPLDPAMLLKLKKAFEIVKRGDPRIDLLIALKPNLSMERQKKIDDAIHILRLLSLMPMLKEEGLLKELL